VDAVFWSILILIISIGLPLVIIFWAFRKFGGTMGSIKNGIPTDAVIQSIAETGMTITSPSIGPGAPVYKMSLLVTPPGGGEPYEVEDTHAIPRLFVPMTLPGARIGVLVDPSNPQKVVPDWARFNAPGQDGANPNEGSAESMAAAVLSGVGTRAGTIMDTAGVSVKFDAQGNPVSGVSDMVGAVRSGSMPTIKGKAATILATGVHGTAVVTTAQPLGKTVRDIDPSADPDRLNDPVWLFTLEVSLAGHTPFPAMFGHRVPLAKVAQIAPGVKLSVAVDESNPSADVAIDWDRSPIGAV
jgi:hypothetical protein